MRAPFTFDHRSKPKNHERENNFFNIFFINICLQVALISKGKYDILAWKPRS